MTQLSIYSDKSELMPYNTIWLTFETFFVATIESKLSKIVFLTKELHTFFSSFLFYLHDKLMYLHKLYLIFFIFYYIKLIEKNRVVNKLNHYIFQTQCPYQNFKFMLIIKINKKFNSHYYLKVEIYKIIQ